MLDKYFPLYAFVFIFTFAFTAVFEKKLIPKLAEHARQPIYSEGPKWHLKKSGTPTMGGLAFLLSSSIVLFCSILFSVLFISNEIAISVFLSLLFAFLNSVIGIVDDLKKLHRRQNAGLTPMQKLLLQCLAAILFLLGRRFLLGDSTELIFSFGVIDMGIIYYPMSVLLLLGIVNCANLTDGIDGLASSVAFAIGVSLFYVAAALSIDTGIVASAIIGASVGFLLFNLHPAKIFMGDTGSLFFGALIASCGFTLKNPFLFLFVSGVYLIEGMSVILQVISYKITRKRIFKMAPIHHHLEKCNWPENRICIVAILLTFVLSVPAYIFYLP